MKTLTKWSARRSGAHMTVTGTDEAGHEIKVSGIEKIEPLILTDGAEAIVAFAQRSDESVILGAIRNPS